MHLRQILPCLAGTASAQTLASVLAANSGMLSTLNCMLSPASGQDCESARLTFYSTPDYRPSAVRRTRLGIEHHHLGTEQPSLLKTSRRIAQCSSYDTECDICDQLA